MVAQSPLLTKTWAGPAKFDPGQVKIIIDNIRRENFWTILGDWVKILAWNTEMAWCHQAKSHYLSQCWPRSLSSYGVTRPQWVKQLSHWGRVTHICVSESIIIGSDNGLSPGRRQAIIWTNAGILLIRTLRTNFSEILIGIHTFSFKKMHLKMSSAKWCPFVSASMC